MRRSLEERFWKKVEVRGEDECWLWTAGKNKKGYGQINSGDGHGTLLKAHRVAWALSRGPIPKGLCVLHYCDVPTCVNERHLWLGSKADNNADMKHKGRANKLMLGVVNPNSKLTLEQVNLILALHRTGMFSQKTIATTIGTSKQNGQSIISGRTWTGEGVIR